MDRFTEDAQDVDTAEVISLPQNWTALRGATPLAQVEAYWYALRGTRLVPTRSDVDPRGIEHALSHAFIVERVAPAHARIRIAGTHMADVMGMEVRGMPLSALFEPEARGKLQRSIRGLFDDPAVQKFALESPGRIGKPPLRGQMSLYPLRDDRGLITRALGCIVTEGTIGRAPRRFEILQARRQILVADESADLPALETASGPVYGQPEPSQVLIAAEAEATFETTAVPWLRIVRGPGS